jgi:hypothetical protein
MPSRDRRDQRQNRRRVADMSGLLAFFGHHKCATQWMTGIIADICSMIDRYPVIYSSARKFGRDLGAAIAEPASTFLCYTNADIRFIRRIRGMRGFHMVRDPRDVVVSSYFSHLYSHPEFGDLADYRRSLQAIPKEHGLLLEMERRSLQFRLMRSWNYEQENVLELRMEDVTADPHGYIQKIAGFLGLDAHPGFDAARVADIVDGHAFEVKAQRPVGVEDVHSHYRKGVAGDWRNHFTEEHVAYFKEHYGDLLLQLGYETSPHWGLERAP